MKKEESRGGCQTPRSYKAGNMLVRRFLFICGQREILPEEKDAMRLRALSAVIIAMFEVEWMRSVPNQVHLIIQDMYTWQTYMF